MNTNEVSDLIRGLLEKTRSGDADWREPNDLLSAMSKGTVRLDLPRSAVTIGRQQNEVIQFRVYNVEGTAIIDVSYKPGSENAKMLEEILNTAIRKARRIDETLDDLTAFLKSEKRKPR